MSTDDRTKRFKKRWNRFFFGNDLRAKITSNLIRAAAGTIMVVSVVAFLAALAVGCIIVIPATLNPVVALSVVFGGVILIGVADFLAIKMFDKANDLEKDYKDGRFKDLEGDLPDVNNPVISNWFGRAKTFIKMIVNTVVEQAKKIWADFHHNAFGDTNKKFRSAALITGVGGIMILSVLAIVFPLFLTYLISVPAFCILAVVGLFGGAMVMGFGIATMDELNKKIKEDEQLTKQTDISQELMRTPSSFITQPVAVVANSASVSDDQAGYSLLFMPAPREERPIQLNDLAAVQWSEIDEATTDWMETRGYSQP